MELPVKTRTFDAARNIFKIRPLEHLLLKIVKGSVQQSTLTKLIPNPHQYKLNTIRKVTRNGINWELDISCMMQWPIYWGLKEATRDRLYSLVNKGDVIVDVGANIGETLLNFAKLTNSEGTVYGFEPYPLNYLRAKRNLSLNSFSNITLLKIGLSDENTQVNLCKVNEHNLGMNRILPEEECSNFEFVKIQTRILDEIVEEYKIPKISLIKIDIEGYEMKALKGATNTLRDHKPKLFLEVGDSKLKANGSSAKELICFIEDHNYEIFLAINNQKINYNFEFPQEENRCLDIYALSEI